MKENKEAGLEPKAEVYGGWESLPIAANSLGYYLSAYAIMYQSTGEEVFKERADYIVSELAECQEAKGNGYVHAAPDGKELFEKLTRGEITSWRGGLNHGQVPFYSLHKLYAGLRDSWHHCGNARAL